MTANAPGMSTTASHPTPSPDALYADAVNLTADRTGMPHPLTESYILAARSGVDAVLNLLRDPDGALTRQVAESIDQNVRLLVLAAGVTLAQFEEQHAGIRDALAAQALDAARTAILDGQSS